MNVPFRSFCIEKPFSQPLNAFKSMKGRLTPRFWRMKRRLYGGAGPSEGDGELISVVSWFVNFGCGWMLMSCDPEFLGEFTPDFSALAAVC
jgi:hypothetical protein